MDLSILSIVARKIQQRPSGQGLKLLNIFNWESQDSSSWKCESSNELNGLPNAHLSVEIIDRESDEEDENGDEGDRHSSVTNVDRKVGQLGLQGELL